MAWPGGSVDWSIVPYTKKVGGLIPVRAHTGGNRLTFFSHPEVSLSFSLPSSPSKSQWTHPQVRIKIKEKRAGEYETVAAHSRHIRWSWRNTLTPTCPSTDLSLKKTFFLNCSTAKHTVTQKVFILFLVVTCHKVQLSGMKNRSPPTLSEPLYWSICRTGIILLPLHNCGTNRH